MGLITIRLDLDPIAVLAHFVLAIAALGGAVVVAIEARALERGRARAGRARLGAPRRSRAGGRLRSCSS